MILTADYNQAEAVKDAERIFPGRKNFNPGELEFAAYCRQAIRKNRAAELMAPLDFLLKKHDGESWMETLGIYLLEADRSIQLTTEALPFHRNTVKYRIQCISDRLGFPTGSMPASLSVYVALGIYRLMN